MKIIKLALGLVLWIFCVAWSQKPSGPIIVSGGGTAELKALYIHQNLASYILGCLIPANPCGLQANETIGLQELVAKHASEVQQISIQFDPQMREPVATQPRLGADIRISSGALYTSAGIPQSTREIGALILAARWSHIVATPLPALLARARTILGSFQDHSERVTIGDFNSVVNFQMSRWLFQNLEQVVMLIEDAGGTTDITGLAQRALPCGRLLDWHWTNMRSAIRTPTSNGMAAVVAIDGVSTCQGSQSKTLVIEMLIRDARVVKEQLRVSLRSI